MFMEVNTMGIGNCCGSGGCGTMRGFLTAEEKIEMLKEYKGSLEKEVQGVTETIKKLEKK